MRYILFNPKTDRTVVADSIADLVEATGWVSYDYENRKITVGPAKLTASWTAEWTEAELAKDFSKEALTLLTRYGWCVYKKVDV